MALKKKPIVNDTVELLRVLVQRAVWRCEPGLPTPKAVLHVGYRLYPTRYSHSPYRLTMTMMKTKKKKKMMMIMTMMMMMNH